MMRFPISDASPIRFAGPPPAACDVVVLGGGVIGVMTAWFLAEKGLRVTLCEKGASRANSPAATGAGAASRAATWESFPS